MILEREHELRTLTSVLTNLEATGGRAVLVRGEAGIGKTALISCFIDAVRDAAHVLTGGCDDLLTPQPLGPFWDVARTATSVAVPLRTGDRQAVMESLLSLLARESRPTVLVLEDMQWADEATLDVVAFLGRRIARTNGVMVLTYRDGEVELEHPLRHVIGGLPPRVLLRLPLARLSLAGVAAMVAGDSFDVEEVLALTGGNPLFVEEVLASGVEDVPSSVQDAVLARAGRLSPSALRTLQLVSVMPGGLERALAEELFDVQPSDVSECLDHALLLMDDGHLSFPHELQRRAVESSLTTEDRRRLNRRVLTALADREQPVRLVHHARQADDVDAIVRYAPRAARDAIASESHREAVAHFRVLEPHLDRLAPVELAGVVDDWGREESYLDNPAAVDLLTRAVLLRRSVGDEAALAATLTFAVHVNEVNGFPRTAEACADEAVSILERQPPTAALAAALSQLAWLRLMRGDDDRRGVQLADRAIEIAEEVGDDRSVAQSLIMKGSILHGSDPRVGFSLVEAGHERAVQGGHRFEEVSALIHLAGLCGDARDVARAADLARRARDTAVRYEFHSKEAFAQAMYAEILLWQGDWAAAEDVAAVVLGAHAHAEMIGWRILGVMQARQGRSEAGATLERMWSLAVASGELQNIDPAATALAEQLWLTDDRDPRRTDALCEVAERGVRSGSSWPSGALTFWMWQLGLVTTPPPGTPACYRLIMEGDAAAAAEFWRAHGVPYEQALALMHGDEPSRIEALRLLDDLGATATARRVREALLADGVRVPRGRSRAAREHAAGLTARQAEVLDLLAEGLTNADVADRLFISHRTVENHVAAILMKLEAVTRHGAVTAARDLGILAANS